MVGVEERQDEDRRCFGDACDSLCHQDAQAVEGLAHRRLVLGTVQSATASGTPEAVDADNVGPPPAVGDYQVAAHAHRILPADLAEDTTHGHHAEVALAQRFSNVGMRCAQAQKLAPVTTPV